MVVTAEALGRCTHVQSHYMTGNSLKKNCYLLIASLSDRLTIESSLQQLIAN